MCHFINSQDDLCCPVYAVLCDGSIFEFFRFDREDTPQIAKGVTGFGLPIERLHVPIFGIDPTNEFLVNARRACETIFSLLLLGYKQALQAYYNRFMKRAKQRGEQQQSQSEWLRSIEYANDAFAKALEAADLHANDQIVEAQNMALQASTHLRARYGPPYQAGSRLTRESAVVSRVRRLFSGGKMSSCRRTVLWTYLVAADCSFCNRRTYDTNGPDLFKWMGFWNYYCRARGCAGFWIVY